MASLIDRMIEMKDSLTKKQNQICNYIILNSSDVVTMTVAELAEKSGVGTTSVMRFVKNFGYDSYGDFKKDLVSADAIIDSSIYINLKNNINISQSDNAIGKILQNISTISPNLLNEKNIVAFKSMVDYMMNADNIYVLGLRSSACIANYFEISLHPFFNNVIQLSNCQEFLYDSILDMTSSDVLLIISEWPCTKKTVDFAKICKKINIPIILITNTKVNPIAKLSNDFIDTNSVGEDLGRVPSILIVEALSNEMVNIKKMQELDKLNKLESVLKENDVILWV